MKKQIKRIDWKQQLSIDMRGGVWCGLFTFVMLSKLIMVCFLNSNDFTSGALTVYGTIIGTYGLTKMGSKFVNGKNGKEVSED